MENDNTPSENTEGKHWILEINELTSDKDASVSLIHNSLSMNIHTNLDNPKDDVKIEFVKTFEF